jgi:phosphopantothenoylcysteine decarboxylase/phosphopantothenate--cysteine ligase
MTPDVVIGDPGQRTGFSALEMYEACAARCPGTDIAVLAAAVADYRPAQYSESKIKKNESELQLALEKTRDIAAALGKEKKAGQILVGFALETEHEAAHALQKMQKKNFDFIALNSLRDPGAGFGHDTNKIRIFRADGTSAHFELKSKTSVAEDIVEEIVLLANRAR